jgi:rSAM/selenodomain-associated transferase 1
MRADQVALAVMARAPSDRGGKTRLLAALLIEDGTDLRRAILLDTMDVVGQVAVAQPVVLYTPATAEAELAELAGNRWGLIPQRGKDLGERLKHAFTDLFAQGYAGALIIGSDLPTLPVEYVKLAATQLMALDDPVVLGPARDGGYYLIGLRKSHPELFRGVAWSTESVLAETMSIARSAALPVSLVPKWYDIDSVEDLRRATAAGDPGAHRARRTEEVLARHDAAGRG